MVRVAQHMLDVTATLEVERRCLTCGHAFRASVRAEGQGTEYGGSRSGPTAAQRGRLHASAKASLRPDAVESLGLVPCPKCARRNGRLVLWVLLRTLPFALVCGALIGCLGLVPLDMLGVLGPGSHHPASTFATWAAAIGAPAAALIELLVLIARIRRARAAVQLLDDTRTE